MRGDGTTLLAGGGTGRACSQPVAAPDEVAHRQAGTGQGCSQAAAAPDEAAHGWVGTGRGLPWWPARDLAYSALSLNGISALVAF
jgi:hypothetical protein